MVHLVNAVCLRPQASAQIQFAAGSLQSRGQVAFVGHTSSSWIYCPMLVHAITKTWKPPRAMIAGSHSTANPTGQQQNSHHGPSSLLRVLRLFRIEVLLLGVPPQHAATDSPALRHIPMKTDIMSKTLMSSSVSGVSVKIAQTRRPGRISRSTSSTMKQMAPFLKNETSLGASSSLRMSGLA